MTQRISVLPSGSFVEITGMAAVKFPQADGTAVSTPLASVTKLPRCQVEARIPKNCGDCTIIKLNK